MEILYIITAVLFGVALGFVIAFFSLKAGNVSRSKFEEINNQLIRSQVDLRNITEKKTATEQELFAEKKRSEEQTETINLQKTEVATLNAINQNLKQNLAEKETLQQNLNEEINTLQSEKQTLIALKSELSAQNETLSQRLNNQKIEIEQMQELAKNEFKNLANQILEEKTQKFTSLNKENLSNILSPFQEKIIELKNKVNETYDREAKERFSLGEKVKELALLNQQISEDAKRLTRALKGESKTQGNWGEMILESILEKSGLQKGTTYFLEHQLTDENNKAMHSQFSGKKMRPDAVVKYPDERTVIIDSKVSLTAFTELVDENDPEIYAEKLSQHLASVKNHINDLSYKAYDDYGKSLDFVMMFIPSEPAYIAAMQADQNLWSYAYERRILLLNPSNLITSLKLIADLWKREYQSRNATEIADRGAKLYDKFVGFIENLEKVGKNIDQVRTAYESAYSQLYTGRDNLITQTQKLKKLGVKNKKELPQMLIDNAENDLNPTSND